MNSAEPVESPELPTSENASESKGNRPDASQLEDRVPEWARLGRQTVLWTVILGILWMFLSYQPLWHTDLWGHLFYGKLIVEQRAIPETEPVLPLAGGVPFRDTAWLSQVLAYGFYSWKGVTAMRFLFALLLMTCVLALLIRFRERTDSAGLCLLGLAIFMCVAWKSLAIIRPQLAGLACYVVLLSLVSARQWTRWIWVIVPLLFVAWANLHGSFPMGIGLLGLLLLGRAGDVWLRTGSFARACQDARARQLLLLTELALIAVLINPYGLGIFAAIQSISRDPNLRQLVEWEPVTLRMSHGMGCAVATLLLMSVYRLSPRRVSLAEPLLLWGMGLVSLWSVRMMVWWSPLAAWFFVLHASSIFAQRQRRHRRNIAEIETDNEPELLPGRSGLNTVLTIGLIWIFFSYTPFGATLLHGYPREDAEFTRLFKRNVSRHTPVDLATYLGKHPPQGLVLNTYEWGDYLLWAGPPGIQLYTNSHAHLLPQEIWDDYFVMTQGGAGWEDKLARYGINTIIADYHYRGRLIEVLKQNAEWQLDYDDSLGAIFLRKEPYPNY